MTMASDTRRFLVLSAGYCGSLWLAASLDKHEDISCSCSEIVGITIPHDSGFEFGAHDPAVLSALMERGSATIDELFARVGALKPAKLVGDVHRYRVSTYREALKGGAHSPARLAHLVRHPAVQLERITLEQIHRYRTFPRVRNVMDSMFQSLCGSLKPLLAGIEWEISGGDLRGLGFLFALNEMTKIFNDVENAPEIPLWTFEQLISDRAYFARLVDDISGGAVEADAAYLDRIFDPEALENSGRFRKTDVNKRATPEQVFAGWAGQEQEAFRRLVTARNLPELYRPVGYDFSFARS